MEDYKVTGEHIYKGITFNLRYQTANLTRIPDFEFREDDILVDTYPKAGTTWIQHITWLIMNNADVKTCELPLNKRFPFIEDIGHTPDQLAFIGSLKSPRMIKSHLGHEFFAKGLQTYKFKVIVGLRNVKDVLVSFYHFYRMNKNMGSFDRGFDDFFELFKQKRLVFGDYFDHVLNWWKEKDNPNVYFVTYEDLKADPKNGIVKLAHFLGKRLTDEEIDTILRETSFPAMQKNPTVNMASVPSMDQSVSKFIRKGEVGDWKNHFNEEQLNYIEHRCAELEAAGIFLKDSI